MPELARRLVEVHQSDDKGYCRGCMAPGGTLFVRWPCGLHRLATAATAPGAARAAEPGVASATPPGEAAAVEPRPEREPGPRYAFGPGRRSAFGPGRRVAPDPPPAP